jgi:hypothetical protein
MRDIFAIFLLAVTFSLFSQERGHIVLNPLTGELEYVTNPYAIGDSLVNLGYDNNIARSTLSTMIGYGNFLGQPDCIAIGWDNSTNCEQNFALGKYIECNGEKVIMIGMSNRKVEARMPGSVAFCPPGEYAVMHIHSGYGMGANTYVGNKGGVRIGQGSAYNTDSTALEIFAHIRENTPDNAQLIATENDEWIVDPDEMILAGSISTGYLECDYTPKVHSGAADTSLLPVPLKVGDYYIDTSARDVYISTGTVRGSWKKAN